MKTELFMSKAWEERISAYLQQIEMGNDYIVIDRYSLGGGYMSPCRGFYSIDVFCLYGRFPTLRHGKIAMRREYLTLVCVGVLNDREPGEYGYHFQRVSSSIFSQTFNLRRLYNLVKDRKFATILGGVVTNEQWEVIKAHYDYTCLRCKRREPEIRLTVDHIIPRSKGGTSVLSNIQPLCDRCNQSKNDTIADYRKEYSAVGSVSDVAVDELNEAWPE